LLPYGIKYLILQSQIQGKNGRINFFTDEATPIGRHIFRIRTGGTNSRGNTGLNYARAIGGYNEGNREERVATAYQ